VINSNFSFLLLPFPRYGQFSIEKRTFFLFPFNQPLIKCFFELHLLNLVRRELRQRANFFCKKFFLTTQRLVTIYSLRTDRQTDRRTLNNSYHRRLQHGWK